GHRPVGDGDRGAQADPRRRDHTGREATVTLTDLDIARRAKLVRIEALAETLGLQAEEVLPYGRYKAKIALKALDRLRDRPDGKLIDVTGINPTPLGEGKT